MIVGRFGPADVPDIRYGHPQGGLRRWASPWIMKRARRLVTNSNYSRSEIEANTPIDPQQVTVVHHGVPDQFGELPGEPKQRMALTVGTLVRRTLVQKGQRPFVEAAALLPDVRFVFVGKQEGDAADELRAIAPENV